MRDKVLQEDGVSIGPDGSIGLNVPQSDAYCARFNTQQQRLLQNRENVNAAELGDEPVFGKLQDGSWLMFDPRLDFVDNTLSSPTEDGGKAAVTESGGETYRFSFDLFIRQGISVGSE